MLKRYGKRSWQWLQHARDSDTKKCKHADERVRLAEAKSSASTTLLGIVQQEFACVAAAIGLPALRRRMDVLRAGIVQRLALRPAIRGNCPARLVQARGIHLMATAGRQRERQAFEKVILHPDDEAVMEQQQDNSVDEHYTNRIAVLAWQWDESVQRLRALMQKQFAFERRSSAPRAMQVMVQSGKFSKYTYNGSAWRVQHAEPMLRPALLLEYQTADFLCEGVLRHFPVDLSKSEALDNLAEHNDLVILGKCCDRASANFALLRWIWAQLARPSAPTTILPFAEPCNAHGVALVKDRPRGAKQVVAKAHSLAALLRHWRTLDALRASILQILSSRLEVRTEQRPQAAKDASTRFIKALFPQGDTGVVEYMYKTNKKGEKEPKPLWQEMQELALLWDLKFSDCEDEKIIHYCWAEPESWACTREGRTAGHPCCRNREEAIERMATPLINIVVHGPWGRSAANRWTYVGKVLRLIIVGFASARILPMALKELKFCWNVADNMHAQLAALIAKDAED